MDMSMGGMVDERADHYLSVAARCVVDAMPRIILVFIGHWIQSWIPCAQLERAVPAVPARGAEAEFRVAAGVDHDNQVRGRKGAQVGQAVLTCCRMRERHLKQQKPDEDWICKNS